jgi:hypothetical protein
VTSETASLVSGSSVLLAAFGFYYNTVQDRVENAAAVGESPANRDSADEVSETIRAGRQTARILGLVALLVFVLLFSYLEHEIATAVDVRFALSAYSTLDVIFVALALGWLGIAAFFCSRAIAFSRKLDRVAKVKSQLE